MSDSIASAAGQLGQSTGISNLASGISDLFTGGSQSPTPGQVANAAFPSDSLFGSPMPPQAAMSPTPAPNFMQGFVQGFTGHTPGGGSVPMGAGGEVGGGLGQLMNAINQLRTPQGMVNLASKPNVPSVDVAQNPFIQTKSHPGLIDSVIKGLTYGLLSSGGGPD